MKQKNLLKALFSVALALLMVLTVVTLPLIAVNAERSIDERGTITVTSYGNFNNWSTDYSLTGYGGYDVVAIAMAQIGISGPDLGYSYAWCAAFVSDCAILAGQESAIPGSVNVLGLRNNIVNAGGMYVSVSEAQAGDIIIIDTSEEGVNNHIEIVRYVSGNTVYTVGGNTGPGSNWSERRVCTRERSSNITCIIRPNYDDTPIDPPVMPTVTTDSHQYCAGETVAITWNAVANNQYYWINVYKNGNLIVDQSMGTDTVYYLTNASVGDYTVYLSANNSAGTSGSSCCYFSVVDTPPDAPVAVASADHIKTGQTVTISWNAVPTTRYYTYYLSEYPFAYAYQTYVQSDSITDTSITFSGLPNGKYGFFVHAVNAAGYSEKSAWIYFDVFDYDYAPVSIWMYNGHIYSVYDDDTSWDFADDFCKKVGGNLVTITSAGESEFINQLISAGSLDAYWIGARSDTTGAWNSADNPFAWTTGEDFSYTNWYSGEPNGMGEDAAREHFAEIRKSYNYQWNDVPNARTSDRGFILETDASAWDSTATMIHGSSKYLLFDNAASWWEAKAFCEAQGEHLATIFSSAEDAAVWDLIQNGNLPWFYLGAYESNGTWRWLDGTTVPLSGSYSNWSGIDGVNVDGPTGWGDYLMKYKTTGTWIGLPNHYDPYYAPTIGFIMEIDNAVNTVTFDPQGGTVTPGSKTIVYGEEYGELPVPERSGFEFEGWFTSAEGGTEIFDTTVVTVKTNQVLYAHWTENQQTLLGDVDLDGQVTAADALLAMRYAMSITTVEGQGLINGDMDGDGRLTASDAVLIMRRVMNIS